MGKVKIHPTMEEKLYTAFHQFAKYIAKVSVEQ